MFSVIDSAMTAPWGRQRAPQGKKQPNRAAAAPPGLPTTDDHAPAMYNPPAGTARPPERLGFSSIPAINFRNTGSRMRYIAVGTKLWFEKREFDAF